MESVNKSTACLDGRSCALRRRIVEVLGAAGRGHIGSSFSLVEILRVLYDHVLAYDPAAPRWPGRDRCILSKGHGCLTQYVLLAEKGFFPEAELNRFCAFDGLLGGHPDPKTPGVEVSTGSLGHGLPVAVGMALAGRMGGHPWRVFAILGDGECDEGSVWEAAMSAAKHRLDNLVVLVDRNAQQSYDTTEAVLDLEPFKAKWEAFGFAARDIDGHDTAALTERLRNVPFEPGRPSALICHTVKGRGVPFTECNLQWHHKSKVAPQEIDAMLQALDDAS